MICPFCEKCEMKRKKTVFTYYEFRFGEFDADVCEKCGEIIFAEESFDKIEKKAKELGVWGIGRKTKLAYAGNSLIVRIPKDVAMFLNLEKGKEVFVVPASKKKIMVEIV